MFRVNFAKSKKTRKVYRDFTCILSQTWWHFISYVIFFITIQGKINLIMPYSIRQFHQSTTREASHLKRTRGRKVGGQGGFVSNYETLRDIKCLVRIQPIPIMYLGIKTKQQLYGNLIPNVRVI